MSRRLSQRAQAQLRFLDGYHDAKRELSAVQLLRVTMMRKAARTEWLKGYVKAKSSTPP